MHRTLSRAFPDADRIQSGLLYRVFSGERDITAYLQSYLEPDIEKLAACGFRPDKNGLPREIDVLRGKFQKSRRFLFNLLCYPSKKAAGEGKNSKRVYLREPDERADWLSRKAGQYGFSVNSLRENASFSLSGRKDGMTMHFYAVEFAGELTIEDEAAFWKGYCDGIGAGKAYGLGLLLLARQAECPKI
jgi:CRISPR-associated protein Cas6/Cse3/CasE subtype I-E